MCVDTVERPAAEAVNPFPEAMQADVTRRLPIGILALLIVVLGPLLSTSVLAEGDVLHFVFSDSELQPRALRAKAALALLAEGAGQVDKGSIRTLADLVPQQRAWLGTAPLRTCDAQAGKLALSDFSSGSEAIFDHILFGELAEARAKSASLLQRLPCLAERVGQASLYRFWFLRGALEFTEGRLAKAEFELSRAVLVDPSAAFDPSFSTELQLLIGKVRREVLKRSSAQVAIGLGSSGVRVDGSPLALEGGSAILSLPLGTHLIQVEADGRVQGVLIELSGLSVRADVPVLAIVDKPALAVGLRALIQGETIAGQAAVGRAAVLCWLAQEQASWALLVQHRKGKMAAVLQADLLSATVRSFRKGPTRGDIYTLRARLGFRGGYRLLRVGGPDVVVDEYRHYGTVSVMIWSRLSWLLRIGGELGFGHTPNPEAAVGDEKCCFLPQGAVRLRLEQPTGTFRPFGEIGLLLLAPYGHDDAYIAVPGFEILGGVVVTPEPTRRIGIEIGAGFGIAPQLGNWVSLRAGPEVRF
jgi:hypothetical protein